MIPASARTFRCLVTPWRVMARKLSESTEIEAGPPFESRCSSARRVSSPSAANSNAALATCLTRCFDILLQPDQYFRPALLVVVENLGAACERNFVKAGFRQAQLCPLARRLQNERDPGAGLT